MKTKFIHAVLAAALLALASSTALADIFTPPTTGIPPLSSIGGGPFDAVNLSNLDVRFSVPIFSRPGTGLPFSYSLTYDSLVWIPVTSDLYGTVSWQPASNWGWSAWTPLSNNITGHLGPVPSHTINCYNENNKKDGTDTRYGPYTYIDSNGTTHLFMDYLYKTGNNPDCPDGELDSFTNATASDDSGYKLSTTWVYPNKSTVLTPSGVVLALPYSAFFGTATDANGNKITINNNGTFTDTLGTTALTVNQAPPVNPPSCTPATTYQYPVPGGSGTATITVSYLYYVVQTNFGVSGIAEFPATGECLVSKITLPDNSNYQFAYEVTVGNGISGKTTGRIATVTLPTGGVISYSYAGSGCGNNSNCMMADGSPSSITKTMSGGQYIGGGPWTYTRAIQSGHQLPQTTTTVVDPAKNETDLNFSGIYETLRTVYSGHKSSVLDYAYTCYNGNMSDSTCPAAVVTAPISSRGHNDHANQITFGYPYSSVWDYYDTYGNLTKETNFNFASPPTLIRTLTNRYNGCTAQNICDELANSQVTDSGGASKSYTTYAYDQGGITHGKVTTINSSTSGSTGGQFLQQGYSYNSNGTLATATDPKLTVTYYNSTGYFCNGAFPNSVSIGGLTTSYVYNCTGGVVTQTTFSNTPNNQITSTSYTDRYFWRPASTTDQSGNITYYNYYGVRNAPTSAVTAPGQSESVLSWTGSTRDVLSTLDSYARPWLSQQRNPQSTWDTVQDFYDTSGRVVFVSLPFTTSAGPGGASQGGISATGYSYDNLGRYTDIETCNGVNCSGQNTSFSYNLNDVAISTGPGQTFSEQLEYDILGRVTSVCEISSSLSGVGACAQNTGQTGYRTSYSYDPLGDLTSVTQGSQTRSYSYDGLGRMTAETNPESGTTTYTFDSVIAGYCAQSVGAYSSPGYLVATADANGNHVCYYYFDGLGRLTDVGNNRQNANNLCHRFRYDNSTGYQGTIPQGINIAYSVGHLVEAETDDCQHNTHTDEWFSYTKRGEKTDVWESTPNSGGWYHVQEKYFANGALYSLQGFTGTGTSTPFSDLFDYGLDGEGRPYNMWVNTCCIWGWTLYNAANQPTSVQHPGGGETFAYGGSYNDSTYGNVMKQWQSTAGSQQQTGTLTWNANGTLYKMVITDPFNAANAQTCTNSYDDLARLTNNGCQGSPGLAESYTYDRYGNISTSDSRGSNYSFQATYNTSNNHITNPYASYDANGNITEDNEFNIFTYDVYNRPVNVNAATKVFDASGRAVELLNSNGYTQFVYAPDGTKFAYMNGQTLQKYMMPMVAGILAVHNHAASGDYGYFVHTDWLGSSRLGVNGGGAVMYDRSYTPFGEPYAELNNENRNNRSFTGQNEDTSSGIYDFQQRQEGQTQGRWLVPDPAGLAAVDITNPQTWNRYAYVGNNPLSNTDPQGLKTRPTVPGTTITVTAPQFGDPGDLRSGGDFGDLLDGINRWEYKIEPPDPAAFKGNLKPDCSKVDCFSAQPAQKNTHGCTSNNSYDNCNPAWVRCINGQLIKATWSGMVAANVEPPNGRGQFEGYVDDHADDVANQVAGAAPQWGSEYIALGIRLLPIAIKILNVKEFSDGASEYMEQHESDCDQY